MEDIMLLLCAVLLACYHSGLAFKLTKPMPAPSNGNSVDGTHETDLFFDPHTDVPEVMTAKLGGRLVLFCEAGGSPSPTIHWLFNGERILQDGHDVLDDEAYAENNAHNKNIPTIRLGSTKSKLYIDCVTEAHAGKYTCVADEPTKRIAKVTKVDVESEFNSDDILLSSCLNKRRAQASTPAHIYMWTAHRLEVEGADVQLFCRASGNPMPKISWVREDDDGNNMPLDSDQFEVLDNGDLFVRRISFLGNMGTYKCTAENASGKDIAEAFLYPTAIGK